MPLTVTMSRVISRANDLKVSMKLSARQLAVLVGMSPTVLGNAFADVTYTGAAKEMELSEVTLLLQSLELAVRPLRLPDNTDHLRKLIDHVRDHGIEPENIRATVQSLFGAEEQE